MSTELPRRTGSFVHESLCTHFARVAELADALDLGSRGATRGGSTPPSRTRKSRALRFFPERGAYSRRRQKSPNQNEFTQRMLSIRTSRLLPRSLHQPSVSKVSSGAARTMIRLDGSSAP